MLHALRPDDDDNTEQVRPPFVPPLAPGTRLYNGRYVVLESAGSGGQGRVYKVLDAQLRDQGINDVIRAVKEMVPPVQQMPVTLPNLRDEAKLLFTLDHAGILTVYDLFTERDRVYIVLKYIEGNNLEEVLAKSPTGSPRKRWAIGCSNCATSYTFFTPVSRRSSSAT